MQIKFVDKTPTLQQSQATKMSDLRDKCNKAILGRFMATVEGVDYWFSCDTEAQANFDKADRAFEKGRTTEETWTAYDYQGNVVRLKLNIDTFEPVYVAHLEHIKNNVSKLRDDLMLKVYTAKSKSDIQKIDW